MVDETSMMWIGVYAFSTTKWRSMTTSASYAEAEVWVTIYDKRTGTMKLRQRVFG